MLTEALVPAAPAPAESMHGANQPERFADLPDQLASDESLAQIVSSIRDHGAPEVLRAPVVAADAMHQRSLCYRLHLADGRSVFAKRAVIGADGARSADVAGEGHAMAALAHAGVRVPRPLLIVDEHDLVVMEDLPGRATLDRRRRDAGGSSPGWAAAYGDALGRLHSATTADSPAAPFVSRDLAGQLVRSWTHVTPSAIAFYPNGYAEKTKRIRASGLHPVLLQAASSWTPTALIHGDVKSDNVLCAPELSGPDALILIDWETVGWGDPRWDVGCLIGDYVYSWLSSMRFDSGDTLDAWIASADPALPQIRTELRVAVQAYGDHCAVDDADRRLWLAFAAMFLLQRLSASALQSAVLPPAALAFLQVAGQLLRRPDLCLEMLL